MNFTSEQLRIHAIKTLKFSAHTRLGAWEFLISSPRAEVMPFLSFMYQTHNIQL